MTPPPPVSSLPAGYDCYLLQQNGRALRLTGCWLPDYEFKHWSNVLCPLREEQGLNAVMAAAAPLSPRAAVE